MEIQTSEVLKGLLGGYNLKKEDLNTPKTLKKATSSSEILQLKEEIKDSSIKSLLNTLFKRLSKEDVSKEDVVKILNNSVLQKSSKSLTGDIESFVKFVNSQKALSKLGIELENLLLHVKDIKNFGLQNQLDRSGLFLESKIADVNSLVSKIPTDMKEILQNLQNQVEDKSVKVLLERVLSSSKVDKSFMDNLKEVISSLKQNNSLESLVAKIENRSVDIKIAVNKIENADFLIKDSKIIDTAQKILETKDVSKDNAKELLTALKSNKEVASSPLTKRLETILSKNMVKEIETKNIVNIAKQITDHTLESKNSIVNNLKDIKTSLNEISNIQNLVQNRSILEIPKLDIQEKIDRVVNLLKQELELSDKSSLDINKLGDRLDTLLKDSIKKELLKPNQPLEFSKDIKKEISQDIKAQLLDVKAKVDALDTPPPHIKESLNIQIDKILTKIEYFQLLSYSSEANISYLPLLWDGLEEGEISIKKLKQKRYFCEIKLKLKDFGNIEMMIMLHDEVYINISFFTENSSFLNSVQKNQKELKRAISSLGLIPENLYFYDKLRDEKIRNDIRDFAQANQIGKGIDIQI